LEEKLTFSNGNDLLEVACLDGGQTAQLIEDAKEFYSIMYYGGQESWLVLLYNYPLD
jgi:hypothetical protein